MMMLICINRYLHNIWSSIHEKLKQRCGRLEKKSVGYIKSVHFVGTYNESVFNPFFVLSWIWRCFYVNREKISFPRPDFVDFEIVIWGLTSLTDFNKRAHLLFKKRNVSHCQKKISFVQIAHLKFTFLTPYEIKSYY